MWLTRHDRGGNGHGHGAKRTGKLQGAQARNRACTAYFSCFAISLTWLHILALTLLHILCLLFSFSLFISAFWTSSYFLLPCNSVFLFPPSVHSDYLSKLAISWLLYRDDVSPCPRVHQVGFRLLYLVKPKLTAGLVWVLLDLTKGLGFILMWVNLVWFIAGLSKKINGGPFESKSLIALCTYVSSLWVFSPSLSLPRSHSLPVFLWLSFLLAFFLSHLGNTAIGSVRGILLLYGMDFFALISHPSLQLKLKPSFAGAGPDVGSLHIFIAAQIYLYVSTHPNARKT